jgi:hypothetical protein
MLKALLRSAIGRSLPRPTREYRAHARLAFEQALDRHLADTRPALRLVDPPR